MKHFLITIALFFLVQTTFEQDKFHAQLKTIADKVIENIIAADKEKALLVTDRKIYAAGEPIYFKAYLIDSIHNYLRSTPAKLYVDYVDEKDSVINNVVLNNTSFQTSGKFVLPDSLPEGFYWMRAYTKEMIKININNIAVSAFYIVNKNQLIKQPATNAVASNTNDEPFLKFYPEGGSVISGINSKIAVTAKNKYGYPQIVSGIIKDNTNDTVSGFTTNEYGLAKFSYFPKWFDRYSVFIKNKNEYDSTGLLPKINFYVARLSVIQQTNYYITLQVALEDSIYTKNYTTYIIGVNRDSVCFASVGRGMYTAQVPVSKLPGGIQTFYLFNTHEQLLSSRSIYIKKDNYHLIINADKNNYAARSAVKLDLHLTDANSKPETALLTLSVVDKNDITNKFQSDDTLQYFSAADADLMMMTQAKQINPLSLTDTSSAYHDDDSNFVLSGSVLNAKNQPVEKCIITILSPKPAFILEADTSDTNGKFKFNLPAYYDSTQFTIQLTNIKGKSLSEDHVVFDKEPVIQFLTPANLKTTFVLSDSIQSIKFQLLKSDSVVSFTGKHWLKPVTVKGYIKPKVNYDESKRVSKQSQIITHDQIGEGPERAGIAILNNAKGRLLFSSTYNLGQQPLLILDGIEMPLSELVALSSGGSANPTSAQKVATTVQNPVLNFINSIPVSIIDFIEVLTGPEAAAYGMEGGHGVILINTRSGGETLPAGVALKNFYAKGFYNDKSFEMPDYANPQILKSKLPDLRKTIYWNGNLVTNKNGDATVEFFTADPPTTYMGVINGVTANGDKVYQTFIINRN